MADTADKHFELDEITNNPNLQVIISAPGIDAFKALLMNDVQINASASYKSLLDSSSQSSVTELVDRMKGIALTLGANIGATDSMNKIMSMSTHNVTQGINFWNSSSAPTFSVQVLLLSLREGDNVVDKVKALYSLVLPFREGKDKFMLQAPMGYLPGGDGTTARNTGIVQIGKWLRVKDVIFTAVNFTFSKELKVDGRPLFATGNIEFKPFREVEANIFNTYFTAQEN